MIETMLSGTPVVPLTRALAAGPCRELKTEVPVEGCEGLVHDGERPNWRRSSESLANMRL
jgi:hypothetical protein